MRQIVETQRFLLREFVLEDDFSLWDLNRDPEVIRYTGEGPFESVQQARTFQENYSDYCRNGFGRWAVLDKHTHAFVGWCGLKRDKEGIVDIGYRFFRSQWGKGYATETASASILYGFEKLGLQEIIGRAHQDNIASIRVFEKTGMQYWQKGTCQGISEAVFYKIMKE